MQRGQRKSIFLLPEASLPEKGCVSTVVEEDTESRDGTAGADALAEAKIVASSEPKCTTCRVEFDDHVEQRRHFKSDWHKHNVARKSAGKNLLTEDEFDLQSDNLSISGSEDEEDLSEDEMERIRVLRKTPQVEFKCPDGKYLIVWKAALPKDGSLKALKDVQKVCIFLCGGGHFAGAVFGPAGKVLEHRTFHRYTTRKKQGGEQGFNDKAARAKSAGASIRRHNLQKLREEIRDLLSRWREHITAADLIFLHAPGKGTRETFAGYDDSPLKGLDIRRVPFNTRRATLQEVQRVYQELTSIYISESSFTEALLKENARNVSAPSAPANSAKGTAAATETKEKGTAHLKQRPNREPAKERRERQAEEEEAEIVAVDPKLEGLFRSCCEGEVEEVLKSFEDLSVNIQFPTGCRYHGDNVIVEGEGLTPLAVAASLDRTDLVKALLERGGDPVACSPYTLAEAKDTKDAFRRFWADNPDKWDYAAGKIPSPLTAEMESERASKAKDKKKRAKQRQKEKAKEKKAEEEAAAAAAERKAAWECVPPPNIARNVAVALSLSASLCASLGAFGAVSLMWWLARRRLPERERRALAMEARMKSKANVCRWCGKSIENLTPFERLSFKYCSTDCVVAHKRELGH